MSLTVFSFGGGVQSTAALVLAAQGDLPVDRFLFANVGDDSERAATVRYIRDTAAPYALAHGIPLEVIRRRSPITLYQKLLEEDSRSVPIPVRMRNGAPGRRSCTADYKIRPIAAWLKRHGATVADPATVMLGISRDEWRRMGVSKIPHVRNAYPLIDRKLSRQDCLNIIASAGLPEPPKSSCWFCPFHSLATWRDMRDREPQAFTAAVALEQTLNARRAKLGKDQVYLTRFGKPLPLAVGAYSQPSLFEDDLCDSGYCMM